MKNSKNFMKIIFTFTLAILLLFLTKGKVQAFDIPTWIGQELIINENDLKGQPNLYCINHAGSLTTDTNYKVEGIMEIHSDKRRLHMKDRTTDYTWPDMNTNNMLAYLCFPEPKENLNWGWGWQKEGGSERQKALWKYWNGMYSDYTISLDIKHENTNWCMCYNCWEQKVNRDDLEESKLEKDDDLTDFILDTWNESGVNTDWYVNGVKADAAKRDSDGYIEFSVYFGRTACIKEINISYTTIDASGNKRDNTFKITKDTNNNSDIFKLYKEDKKTPINNIEDIERFDKIYVYCPYSNYQITKINMEVPSKYANRYWANLYMLKSAGNTKQRLVYAEIHEEEFKAGKIEIPVEDGNKINLTIKKAGGAKVNNGSVMKTKDALKGVTFNLKLLGGGSYVGIDNQGFVKYYTDPQPLTTNENGEIKIYGLKTGKYMLIETSIGENEEYRPEIIKATITSNNGTVTINENNPAYLTLELNTDFVNVDLDLVDNANTGSLKVIKKGPYIYNHNQQINLENAQMMLFRDEKDFNQTKYGFVTRAQDGTISYQNNTTGVNGTKFTTDSNGEFQVDKLNTGTYRIYEIKSPDEHFYKLSGQTGYGKDDISKQNGWVYLGKIEVSSENTKSNPALPSKEYFENKLTVGSIKIVKKGPDKVSHNKQVGLSGTQMKLFRNESDSNHGFVVKASDGTISYKNNTTGDGGTTFTTDAKGEFQVDNLDTGTYKIYEIKSSDEGFYKLSEQPGYGKDDISKQNGWVYLGEIKVSTANTESNPALPSKGYFENKLTVGSIKIVKKGPDKSTHSGQVNLAGTQMKLFRDERDYNGTKYGFVTKAQDGTISYKNNTTGEGSTTFTTNNNGEFQVDNLNIGTYKIYEIKSSDNRFYKLSEQSGYGKDNISKQNGWVYLGEIEVSADNTESKPALPSGGYFQNELTVASLKIIKKDSKIDMTLAGAKFKLYSNVENAWVTQDGGTISSKEKGYEFTTKSDGTVTIENLCYGNYTIYETEAPKGYDITKQTGYGSDSKCPNWVKLSTVTLNKNQGAKAPYEVAIENKKIVASLEGYVWNDLANGKNAMTDELYINGSKDKLLKGITVELYDGNGTNIATTTTDNKGYYKFTKKNKNASGDIYYWDLANGYVKFIYNDKAYITVTPFVGRDVKINSKAQEENVKLDDNALTGTGEAVTYRTPNKWDINAILENNKKIANKIYGNDTKNPPTSNELKETPITGYYDERDYTVKNINLGLVDVVDPTYTISEELAYIKVKLNGYTYTYIYGEATDINSNYVPKVNVQNTKDSYNRYAIYPCDIAYSMKDRWTNSGKLQVYVVYKIDITNTTALNLPKVYREEKLFLNSLTNEYDSNRYDLCNNENNTDSTDFALWSNSGNGTASYSINNNNSVYKNGLTGGETIRSYIQFKIKEPALERILSGESIRTKEDDKEPSIAKSMGYHDYIRQDNVWKENKDKLQETVNKRYANSVNEKYYTHKSVIKPGEDSALCLKISLGDDRKLTGTVYEDTKAPGSGNENLGNGVIDGNEKNRAKAVKVELVDRSGNPVYRYPDKNASGTQNAVYTNNSGYYEFVGVVPGYYYIKYTYGDGTQKMVDLGSGGNVDINLRDYKSTIVTSNVAKNAMKKTSFEKQNNAEIQNAITTLTNYYAGRITNDSYKSAQELLEWYKSSDGGDYSIASDNIMERAKTNGFVYNEDGSIYNGGTKVSSDDGYILDGSGNKMVIHSYTPMIGISIENDTQIFGSSEKERTENVHKNSYNKMNLGIIKETPQDLKVEKKITNVKLANAQGTSLVSSNPKQGISRYLSDLDGKTAGGSKYARLEIEKESLYGSSLETTYEVSISNNSYEDYIEEQSSPNYGWYFKYGEKVAGSQLKKITVKEVIDELDEKYEYDKLPEKITETKITNTGGRIVTENKLTVTPEKNVTETYDEKTQTKHVHVKVTGWDSITTRESVTMSYVSKVLYGNEMDDSSYINDARITQLNLDNLTTLSKEKAWGADYHSSTTLTVMPSTGEDRSNKNIIIITIAISALGIGIILIMKIVLKKKEDE